MPTNAAHDPVLTAREITPNASDHAATPLHPTTRPALQAGVRQERREHLVDRQAAIAGWDQ